MRSSTSTALADSKCVGQLSSKSSRYFSRYRFMGALLGLAVVGMASITRAGRPPIAVVSSRCPGAAVRNSRRTTRAWKCGRRAEIRAAVFTGRRAFSSGCLGVGLHACFVAQLQLVTQLVIR